MPPWYEADTVSAWISPSTPPSPTSSALGLVAGEGWTADRARRRHLRHGGRRAGPGTGARRQAGAAEAEGARRLAERPRARRAIEARALALCDALTPGVVPRLLHHDAAAHTVVLELAPADRLNWQAEIGEGRAHAEVGRFAGETLGDLASRDGGPPGARRLGRQLGARAAAPRPLLPHAAAPSARARAARSGPLLAELEASRRVLRPRRPRAEERPRRAERPDDPRLRGRAPRRPRARPRLLPRLPAAVGAALARARAGAPARCSTAFSPDTGPRPATLAGDDERITRAHGRDDPLPHRRQVGRGLPRRARARGRAARRARDAGASPARGIWAALEAA